MTRRKFTSKFKTKVALAAIKEHESLSVLAQKYDLLPQQITAWKRAFIDGADVIFDCKQKSKKTESQEKEEVILKIIGQQKVEIEFFKKDLVVKSIRERRNMIDKDHVQLSIVKQCKLLNVSRCGLYYKPAKTSDLNLELMRLIDEHYLKHPYKGGG